MSLWVELNKQKSDLRCLYFSPQVLAKLTRKGRGHFVRPIKVNMLPSWSHVIGSCSIGISWIRYTVSWEGQWTTERELWRRDTDHKQELITDRTLKSSEWYIVWPSSDLWKCYFYAGLLWQVPDRNKLFSNDAFQCCTRNGWRDKQQRLVNLPGTNDGTNVSIVVNEWLEKSHTLYWTNQRRNSFSPNARATLWLLRALIAS